MKIANTRLSSNLGFYIPSDGSVKGKDGVVYAKDGGFCLETEVYPDSINQKTFPHDSILRPGRVYDHRVTYRFFDFWFVIANVGLFGNIQTSGENEMDTCLNKIYSIYAACDYNNILLILVFVIPNSIEFSLYSPINIVPANIEIK